MDAIERVTPDVPQDAHVLGRLRPAAGAPRRAQDIGAQFGLAAGTGVVSW